MRGDLAFQRQIDDAVRAISENRSTIDQAKGMLMVALGGISAGEAFDLLVQQSQQHNVKVRLIAEQIVGDFSELSRSQSTICRADTRRLLASAHRRIAIAAARPAHGQLETD